PYYKTFFEEYGFQVYFYQLTFARKVRDPLSPRLAEKAELIARNPEYSFRYLRKDEMPRLAEYLHHVSNKAWGNRCENPEITLQQAPLMVRQVKPIRDRKSLYFGFDNDVPVSFFRS